MAIIERKPSSMLENGWLLPAVVCSIVLAAFAAALIFIGEPMVSSSSTNSNSSRTTAPLPTVPMQTPSPEQQQP